MKIKLNANNLAAIYSHVAVNDVRYYLNGIQIEPSPDGRGVILVATNGHTLAAGYDAAATHDMPQAGVIIELDNATVKACAKADDTEAVEIDTVSGTISGNLKTGRSHVSLLGIAKLVDGRFPDWRRVVPKSIGPAHCVNAPFNLAYLENALNALPIGKYQALVLRQNPKDSAAPILVTSEKFPNRLVVIMPIRASSMSDALRAIPGVSFDVIGRNVEAAK